MESILFFTAPCKTTTTTTKPRESYRKITKMTKKKTKTKKTGCKDGGIKSSKLKQQTSVSPA